MNEKKQKILTDIKDGLIVSCQAREGWPMYGADIMAAFATAAEQGGAIGIRANKPENIAAIKQKVRLPIVGINKVWDPDYSVYITPTYNSAAEVIAAGCDIVAIDATLRRRPNGETLPEIIHHIKQNHPDVLIMGDVSTFEEGVKSVEYGVDIVSTTLAGYTEYTSHITGADFALVERLAKALETPVVAEGKIHDKEEARRMLELGAHAVVVGTAITRPEIITRWFADEIKSCR
ncbi:N-acetylmannosamine-6-phosphate 2-epimerase [Brevibacillus sp. B_LB10_24]|uniref:N-acetylmannosamine-6-phosphate 2-epimerase n=1 Tax=Brevibacillus sp. B_LB10_24 TaxID=3380645 RepID=UPI0038BB7606